MRLINFVALGLFLGSFNVESSEIDAAKESNENQRKTQFTNLNEDCVFLIFEFLKLDDLVNVAQVNDQLSAFATDVFRHKYSRLQIVIFEKIPVHDVSVKLENLGEIKNSVDTIQQEISSENACTESATQVKLASYDLIWKTFKYFGHLIKRLKSGIFVNQCRSQAEFVGRLISEHSAESLIELEIGHSAELVLEYIKNPLINAKSVAFRGNDLSFQPLGLCFGQLFPAVQRLNFFSSTQYCLAHFDCLMPHLEHISMIRSANENAPFPEILVKNPQITSIELYGADLEFLQKVKNFLPQLKTLTLQQFELENGNIQFDSVTTFIFGYFSTPNNLHFPNLRTLHIQYNQFHSAEYCAFLNEHNHLHHLNLKLNWAMSEFQFRELTENLTELVEITLEQKYVNSKTLDSTIIVNFLSNHHNVKQFNIINLNSDQKIELAEQLNYQWDAKTNNAGMTFVRRI